MKTEKTGRILIRRTPKHSVIAYYKSTLTDKGLTVRLNKILPNQGDLGTTKDLEGMEFKKYSELRAAVKDRLRRCDPEMYKINR